MKLSSLFVSSSDLSGCLATREEGVSHNLGGLTSCESVGWSEVRPVLVITWLCRGRAWIPVHYSWPVDQQPLHKDVEGASNRYICECKRSRCRVREACCVGHYLG